MTDPMDFGSINFRHIRHHDRLSIADMVEIAKLASAHAATEVERTRKEYAPLLRAVATWKAARINFLDLLRTRPRTPDADFYLAENAIEETAYAIESLRLPEG